ncbi:hypothetical protein LTR62_004696 [Meristemomyces frigidus]|uniref:AB hydrolase-1 domain-containing protein n=1 Tax=Meristemomyces frigidus TaxID=1508187 RepID=A0AAN7TF92_9PEZI|nr:hypothetical protein LTR62_004696 [Meristemomyces frigidus]
MPYSKIIAPKLQTTDIFLVKTHEFPAQHIREYARGTRNCEEAVLYLEAKQYIPLSNPEPGPDDVTILASAGIGFPKELYEVLFEHLLTAANHLRWRIRSIWIVDASNQGASGVLNERILGDEPSSFNQARDMLHMINAFRSDFVPPIVGLGHSMGATSLLQLSLIHPRLLASLVLFDPILGSVGEEFANMFYRNSLRPDLWHSPGEAEEYFRQLWKKWDPRVTELWMQYGLRDTPTVLYPQPGQVTLRTTKAQEGWLYGRPAFAMPPGSDTPSPPLRAKYPDMNHSIHTLHPFYRPEDAIIWADLPRIRPSVLYVAPSTRPGTSEKTLAVKVNRTGTGLGGSGGVSIGRVASTVVDDVGHNMPFEKPRDCAVIAAEWIGRELQSWRRDRRDAEQSRDDKSVGMLALSEEWVRRAKVFYDNVKRARAAKL